jgi:hypothetical protein
MKDPTGAAAPTGGFQNNGWYSGYNYYNGNFSSQAGAFAPGNPNGNGTVSSAVNQQSSVAQGKAPGAIDTYIQQQNANPNNNPAATNAANNPGGTPQDMSVFTGAGGTPSSPTGAGAGANIAGAFGGTQPALNLPGLYTSLSASSGIPQMEADLTAKSQAFNDAQSKINDNPFLSEGDRVGRISKLTTDYNNDVKTTQDSLAMAKQDVQTQLDLQTKQFDINSQQSQQALSEFNTLLSSGALAGASGTDIAAITKATGISSSMVQAAIGAQQQKDTPTSVTTVDDGTNQYAVVINTKTGAVISKQVLAASKPTAASTGGTPGSAEYLSSAIATLAPQIRTKLNSYGNISPTDWNTALSAWLSAGLPQKDFVANFGQYADTNRGDFLAAYGFANPKNAATIKANQAVNTTP